MQDLAIPHTQATLLGGRPGYVIRATDINLQLPKRTGHEMRKKLVNIIESSSLLGGHLFLCGLCPRRSIFYGHVLQQLLQPHLRYVRRHAPFL